MAKIRFGDYLKSKQKTEAVYESDESIAKRAKALIRTDSCAVQPHFHASNLKKALELLDQIPDHPESASLAQECRKELEKTQEQMVRMDYENAKYHLKTASTEHEFQKASEELAAVSKELKETPVPADRPAGSMQDVDSLKTQADAQIRRYSAKTTRKRWTTLIVLVAVAGLLLYGWTSGYIWYLAAKLEGLGGIYDSAYSRFYKLGDYLDSREQYQYYKEKYLRKREKEESSSLPEAKVGDKVKFSDYEWTVLEKNDTKLTLLSVAPSQGSAFANVTYDGEQKALREEMSIELETETEISDASVPTVSSGSASWEKSSLRSYLNEVVLEHEFTPGEIEAIEPQTTEPTVNESYGTMLDESVEDMISILSVEMVQEYEKNEVLDNNSADIWLRTPGHDMESAAYLTADGNLILYGNDVADHSLSVRPIIIVDYTKLES